MAKRRARNDDFDDEDDFEDDDLEEELEELEEDEDEEEEVTATPPPVMVASWIWIITGSLVLLGMLASLVLYLTGVGGNQGPDLGPGPGPGPDDAVKTAYTTGVFIGMGLMGLFAAVFIHVGIQSLQGLAKDTMGNGIGSLLFGILELGAGLIQALGPKREMVTILFLILVGFALIFAGILALVGRGPYLAYVRHVQRTEALKKKRKKKR